MAEYGKCNFCKYNELYIICPIQNPRGCLSFEPSEQKIISKAKSEEISVADVIALINWRTRNG